MAHVRSLFASTLALLLCMTLVCGFPDWLVDDVTWTTDVIQKGETLTISNGLISRTFTLSPDFATIDYYSIEKQSSLLRAISPELVISLDGITYNVGGLNTSIPRAYLNRTALEEDMKKDENAFHFISYEVRSPEAPFNYTPQRGAPKDITWPPKGKRLDVLFRAPYWAPLYHKMVTVTIHYEMYDGVPLMTKWATISTIDNLFKEKIYLAVLSVESLAVNWQWAQGGGYEWLFVQTDQAHNTNINWTRDASFDKMPGSFENSVSCLYEPVTSIPLDGNFTTFKALELLIGSSEQERVGLSKRKMMRLLAPHTQENPIFFHTVHTNSTSVRQLIDQMANVGFEMLIFSFGSSFDFESDNDTYIAEVAADVAYAKARGIEVGGYDLIALTRRVKAEWLAKYPGIASACFASEWYDFLLESVLNMMNKTGITNIESDGPYSGYPCSATDHAHHQGEHDSVYQQTIKQNEFYKILRNKGVYINQPDIYFYQGGSKTAMGYNENQYSLPRWQDLSVSRQGMFDDTFHYIPTVGWMFLPLVQYHAGGSAATFEPLSNNSKAYNFALAQYFGAGVAAAYRGYRLYDGPETQAIVSKWVSFFKKYRDILTSDIIHVRRADMQSMDCLMHVNPRLDIRALAMIFNPTESTQTMTLSLPLYYSGITYKALVSQEAGPATLFLLDRKYNIDVPIKLQPLAVTWLLIQEG